MSSASLVPVAHSSRWDENQPQANKSQATHHVAFPSVPPVSSSPHQTLVIIANGRRVCKRGCGSRSSLLFLPERIAVTEIPPKTQQQDLGVGLSPTCPLSDCRGFPAARLDPA